MDIIPVAIDKYYEVAIKIQVFCSSVDLKYYKLRQFIICSHVCVVYSIKCPSVKLVKPPEPLKDL